VSISTDDVATGGDVARLAAPRRSRGGVRCRIRLLDPRDFPAGLRAACLLDHRSGAVLDAEYLPAHRLRLATIRRDGDRLLLRANDPIPVTGDEGPEAGTALIVAGRGADRDPLRGRGDLARLALALADTLRRPAGHPAFTPTKLAEALRDPTAGPSAWAARPVPLGGFRGRPMDNPAAAALRVRGLLPADLAADPRGWDPRRLDALLDRLADADGADPDFRPGLLAAMRQILGAASAAVDDEDLLAALAAPHLPLHAALATRPFLIGGDVTR
jgi:hypothetical protein